MQPPTTLKQAFSSLFSPLGGALLSLSLLQTLADQTLSNSIQNELSNPEGASAWLWVYGATSFFLGLLLPVLMTFLFLILWRSPSLAPGNSARDSFSYLVREEMRVLGQTLLWGLAFVLPGALRFFQLLFVPYVVVLDPSYAHGQVDALRLSRLRINRVWGQVLLLFLGLSLGLPLLMTAFDELRSFSMSPVTAFPLFVFEFCLLVLFQWYLLLAWEKSNGPHFQSPAN